MSESIKDVRPPRPSFVLGEASLSIEDLVRIARGAMTPVLGDSARARMLRSSEIVSRLHEGGGEIYGVTTSVGGSVDTLVPKEYASDLSLNVLRMHGIGLGRILDEEEAAAVLTTRLSSLAQGLSGIRPAVAERMIELLGHGVLPRIPAEGSVGASGDLTPLSYVAAMLVGEREVSFRGEECSSAEAHRSVGLEPLALEPKEGLALMNGTSVTTALACLAWVRARRLARLAARVTAMASVAVRGNPVHFDEVLHAAKPHPGQRLSARWIQQDLAGMPQAESPARLQDRYSIRCAPHVIGVLVDSLRWSEQVLETELNGVSDNPIVDLENERVLHGGNFYAGHVGFVCDSLKNAVANVACLLDRQLMLLCSPKENEGLPADLVGVSGPDACAHNGFKAASISASSLAAEAMKHTMPASAFSRSTELHNQDKVPMATTSARDLLRVLELSENVAGIATLASCQALDLRGIGGAAGPLASFHAQVRERVPRLEEDRRMDLDHARWIEDYRQDAFDFGALDLGAALSSGAGMTDGPGRGSRA